MTEDEALMAAAIGDAPAAGTIPRSALVTGGARRIGRAIVEDLARHGWMVAIHCNRSSREAEALAAEIRAGGGTAGVVAGDLADAGTVAGILAAAEAAVGPIGLLVNSASMFEPDAATDLAAFDRHLAVNLKAPLVLARDLAERLPPTAEGLVVNVVDQRVWRPTPMFFSYTLSKMALWDATRTLAQALAPRVRVVAVGPGPALASARQTPADFARQQVAVPLRRGPALAEFGATIRYLVEARSVTGQMIALDGGQHLAWETADVVGIGE